MSDTTRNTHVTPGMQLLEKLDDNKLAPNVMHFGRVLRAAGLPLGPGKGYSSGSLGQRRGRRGSEASWCGGGGCSPDATIVHAVTIKAATRISPRHALVPGRRPLVRVPSFLDLSEAWEHGPPPPCQTRDLRDATPDLLY